MSKEKRRTGREKKKGKGREGETGAREKKKGREKGGEVEREGRAARGATKSRGNKERGEGGVGVRSGREGDGLTDLTELARERIAQPN